jgi:multidrug efflux pump subunit AcrB
VLIIDGGILSFFELGQLEAPEFTLTTAVVTNNYPGASSHEVELEVIERIELAVQELKQLDYVTSYSRAGQSVVALFNRVPAKHDTSPVPGLDPQESGLAR